MRQTAALMLGESEARQALFYARPHSRSNRLHFKLLGNSGDIRGERLAALTAEATKDRALLLGPMESAGSR